MDTYYHKRDHSLLIALHNPVGTNGTSASSWNTKLHSNVGFRNYLEHVVSSIRDWVREQVLRLAMKFLAAVLLVILANSAIR